MKERGEFGISKLCCTRKRIANCSVEANKVLELSKEKTVPEKEKRLEEKRSEQFSHGNKLSIWDLTKLNTLLAAICCHSQ